MAPALAVITRFGRTLFISNYRIISRACVSVGAERNDDGKCITRTPLSNALCNQFPKHSNTILNLLHNNPQLQQTQIALWDTFFNSLNQFGFDVVDCINILLKEPQVFCISNIKLCSIVGKWNDCPISNDVMKLLVINRPELLFIPTINVEKRVPILQQFVSNQKSLTLLLLQCPNVLTERWESVQAKIDYLTNVMNLEKSDIVNSCALNKSIEHITLRHTLLEKCGMFVTPSPYEHKRIKNEKSSFKNPPLKRIVDNENISFAKKICKISPEEYYVYKEMIEDELRCNDEYNSDSGNESD